MNTEEHFLKCRIIEELECRDNSKNPVGSGVPAVKVRVERNFNTTTGVCIATPISIAYASYHFTGHDLMSWRGSCTGKQTIISTWKSNHYYKPNDGVVLTESSARKILVNKSFDNRITHKIGIMPKTNHDQMKNSQETKKALLELYEGVKYGSFFKLKTVLL